MKTFQNSLPDVYKSMIHFFDALNMYTNVHLLTIIVILHIVSVILHNYCEELPTPPPPWSEVNFQDMNSRLLTQILISCKKSQLIIIHRSKDFICTLSQIYFLEQVAFHKVAWTLLELWKITYSRLTEVLLTRQINPTLNRF